MPRYIDADELICSLDGSECLDTERDYEEIERRIEECETADVQEVRHGKWIAKKRGKYKDYLSVCSLCGHQILNDFIKESKYCPNCGAKMDGEGK